MNSAEEILIVLIAFGSVLLAVGLWLILPVLSWMRVSRLRRELADVQTRLVALEAAAPLYAPQAAVVRPQPESSVPPPAPAPPVVATPIAEPPPIPEPVVPGQPVAAATVIEDESSSLEQAIGGQVGEHTDHSAR